MIEFCITDFRRTAFFTVYSTTTKINRNPLALFGILETWLVW